MCRLRRFLVKITHDIQSHLNRAPLNTMGTIQNFSNGLCKDTYTADNVALAVSPSLGAAPPLHVMHWLILGSFFPPCDWECLPSFMLLCSGIKCSGRLETNLLGHTCRMQILAAPSHLNLFVTVLQDPNCNLRSYLSKLWHVRFGSKIVYWCIPAGL